MYAVIETGGKQYRVQPGTILQIEKLPTELGKTVSFDQVLLFSAGTGTTTDDAAQISLGKPLLKGASVQADVVGTGRGDKVLIIKMKRRKQYRRTQGHRQEHIQVLVTSLDNGSGTKAELASAEKKQILSKFVSQLKEKGEAFAKKNIYGGRKRAEMRAAAKKDPASPKGAAKSAPKSATKKAKE